MKVFLSWSGDCSRRAAAILHDWLPSVLQNVEPYMSSEDIDTGERWSISIAKKLQETDYGVICVTPQNIEAPWLLFESGALSKSLADSRVSPILFGLQQSDLAKSPLVQFQISAFSETDIKKLLTSINNSAPDDEKVSSEVLVKSFRRAWSELNEAIQDPTFQDALSTPAKKFAASTAGSPSEAAIQEILANTRSQLKLLNSPEAILPQRYLTDTLGRAGFARGVAPSHAAWADLRRGTQEVRDVLSLIDEAVSDPSEHAVTKIIPAVRDILQSSYKLLKRSTEYIYIRAKSDRRPEFFSRRDEASADEVASFPLNEKDN